MTTKIEMHYDYNEGRWAVVLDNETFFVEVPESYETTALALASCAYAGFDLERCFPWCEYEYDTHTIYYEC